jgi:beta-1,4-mannosyltransferase
MASSALEKGAALPRKGALARSSTARRIACFPPILGTNPYQRLLYEQLETHGIEVGDRTEFRIRWLVRNRRRIDLLHFHWPQGYWRPQRRRGVRGRAVEAAYLLLFLVRLRVAKLLGFRIAWTIHQVDPHERATANIDRIGSLALARASDVLLTHDRATAAAARAALGEAAAHVGVVEHGSYIGVYPPGRPRAEVRRELGIGDDQLVFLHLGDIRAYKDIERLLAAFRAADLGAAALVVAGKPVDAASERAILGAADTDHRVHALLGFVPDERIAELYEAADIAVLARSDGGTSGSLILALSMGRPAVAADRPAYHELLYGEIAGWLFQPESTESLAAALERAARADAFERDAKGRAALARARGLDWVAIGRRTARLLFPPTAAGTR